MSGFEIAGIVLGGFPILIEAAQPLSRYFQGAERWWHFKRDFMTLISTIEDESIAYSQNLELLLTPVDIDLEVKASLQEDSGSRLWYDPEIQAKLRGRIKIQYMSWFLRQLIEMRETLSEILGMLPIKKNGEVDFPRTTTVDYELFRLKQSFSTRRQHLLDKIVRINESLYKFLAKDSHINAEAARSATSWKATPPSNAGLRRATTLLRLQSEAKKLSSVLLNGWNCHCPHQCGVGHDWRSSEVALREPSLNLLLERGALMKQIRVQTMTADNLESIEATSSRNITMLEQISELRVQARQELTPTAFEKSARRPGIASSAVAATSILARPAMPIDLKFWQRREQKKLTKNDSPKMPQNSGQTTSSSSTSTRRSVRSTQASSSASSAPSRHSQKWIHDTCSFLKSNPTSADQLYLGTEQDAVVFSLDQSNSTRLKVTNLEVFYGSTPRLPDRLQIGLEIALTILGLGTSCWVPRGWDRREILVLNGPNNSTKPFLHHESLSFTLKETIENTKVHTEVSLFSLGVVLLELIYQETLEQQPFWNTYCENGEPNDWTHQRTAMEWQSHVEARYGDDLSEPIRLCVEGGFSSDVNLDNSGFLQEVVDTVVNPLERFLSGWKGVKSVSVVG